MKLNASKQKSTNIYELDFNVEAKIFNEHLDKVFAKNSKKINIPGFRKGKAPRQVIEKLYGNDLFFSDALNDLWPSEFELALQAANINNFIAVDKVDVVSISKKDGVHIRVDVITKPEVELGGYKNIEIECEPLKVTEKEVDETINKLAENVARIVPVQEGALCKNGNIVNLNFRGFIDSKPLEGGQYENYDLTIGKGQFIEGFEEQIVGHKKGDEFRIKVKFPEDYIAENIAGKDAEFDIKINDVKELQLPKMDDEFAKDVSEFDTLEALRENVKKRLLEERTARRKVEVEEKVFDKIVENMKVEMPEIMIQRQIDQFVHNFTHQLEAKGVKLENYLNATKVSMEEFREKFRERAEKQVKVDLAIEKISELEKIELSDDDIKKNFMELAEKYKIDPKQAQNMPEVADLKLGMKLNKAVELVIDSAVIKEKKRTTRSSKKTEQKDNETH